MLGACVAPAPPASASAARRSVELLAASDEAYLDHNPIDALYRGDTRRSALHGALTFHRQVLETGSVPLAVLEAKVEAWIAAKLEAP